MIKQPSHVMAKQHNRKAKGGLVAGALLAGLLLVGNTVSANDAVATPAPAETAVVVAENTATTPDETTEKPVEAPAAQEAPAAATTSPAEVATPTTTDAPAPVEGAAATTEVATPKADATTNETATPAPATPAVAPATTENTAPANISNRAQVVAHISNNSASGQNTIFTNVRVQTSINGTVNAGDYVEYNFQNIFGSVLNGKDVTLADGTVIGKLTVRPVSTAYDQQVNGSADVKANLTPQASFANIRVYFNQQATKYNGLDFNFIANENQTVTVVAKDATITQKVLVDGGVVGQASFVNKASNKENPSTPLLNVLEDRDVESTGDDLVAKNLSLGLRSVAEKPIRKGTQVKLTFGPNSSISFNDDTLAGLIGKTINFTRTRSYFDGMDANKHGVVVFDDTRPAALKIISATKDAVVFESLSDLLKDSTYVGLIKDGFVLNKIDPTTVDIAAMKFKGVNYTYEIIEGGKVINTATTTNDSLNIYGAKVNAAVFNKRGTVRIEYRDIDNPTGDVIHKSQFVAPNKIVGTKYDANNNLYEEVKWDNGRTWRKTGTVEDVTGTVKEGTTTLTQWFKEVKGSVVEVNVSEDGEDLSGGELKVVTDQSLGTAYDTTAQDQILTLADGRKFYLISTTDNAAGKVKEGTIKVINVYRLIENKVPNDFPTHEKPQADVPLNTKVPNEAPVHEKPELKIPEKPATPPAPSTPVVPASVAPTLPETGEASSILSVLGGAMLTVTSYFGLAGRKRKED